MKIKPLSKSMQGLLELEKKHRSQSFKMKEYHQAKKQQGPAPDQLMEKEKKAMIKGWKK